jgi:hypothetical protein
VRCILPISISIILLPIQGKQVARGDTNRCGSAEISYICNLIEEFIGLDVIPLSGKKCFSSVFQHTCSGSRRHLILRVKAQTTPVASDFLPVFPIRQFQS